MNIYYFCETDNSLFYPSEVFDFNSGEFYVPLKEDGKLFDKYFLDYKFYKGQGEWDELKTITSSSVTDNSLKFDFDGFEINFKIQEKSFKYKGKLKCLKYDFKHLVSDDLDDLLDKTGFVILGKKHEG